MNLDAIAAIDQHAHNVLRLEHAAALPFATAFTEGHDPATVGHFARQTLFFRRSLRDLAELLDCEPTEASIVDRRDSLGLAALTQRCFRAANLEMVLFDDGFLPDQIEPIAWHAQFVPAQRVLRIETLAEELIPRCPNFPDFVERFVAALDAPPPAVVAFKSIVAYRTGLEIRLTSFDEAAANFTEAKRRAGDGPIRLVEKPLLDFLLEEALEAAARRRLPFQLHTGFGDPDLDLRLANPLHLRRILDDARFRDVPLVLLHASYPFVREAGYLASVYPQVYLDFGLAVPYLSVAGMRSALTMLLELAPPSKVLYSSDAHYIPELFYLAAKWGRAVLGDVLEGAVADGDLSAAEAEQAGLAILRENARRLYFSCSGTPMS